MSLRILLLGTLHVETGSQPLEVDTRKALALLAYLAMTEAAVSRSTLAALLWSDYDEANARAALRRTLSVLNRALGGEGLVIARDSVGLGGADAWLDVRRFRELADQCDQHGHGANEACRACLVPLAEAAALYRGDFLEGFALRDSLEFEEWQLGQAERLRRELDGVLARLVTASVQASRIDDGLAYAHRRLALDPLNESVHQALMRLYALKGDRAASLRQYRQCVRVLDEELGVAPLEETTAVYESILSGGQHAEAMAALPTPQPEPALEPPPAALELPLAGRDKELRALLSAYDALDPDGWLVVIEGEAGIGKTRLVRELTERVGARGGIALASQCYEGEADLAYSPVIALLRQALTALDTAGRVQELSDAALAEAARILPAVSRLKPGLPPLAPLDSPAARSRFYEGLGECIETALRGSQPGLIVLEDVHWCDDASIGFISYLVRRLQGERLLLVLTWRSEELAQGHRLRRLRAERLREGHAQHIHLSRFTIEVVRQLVDLTWSGRESNLDVASRLFKETEGLPFFLSQYLLDGPASDAEDWPLPAAIGDLMRSRLARVTDADVRVLSSAAVIGRGFDFDLVREVSARGEEEALTSLEQLVSQGFLQVAPASRSEDALYDFTHEKLKTFVYEEMGPTRRQLLHRRTAEALIKTAGQAVAEAAAQVAHHYEGAHESGQAARYFKLAGEHAQGVGALAEALSHFQSALLLGYEPAGEVHRQVGLLRTLAGAYKDALASYQTAAALASEVELPEVEHKIGGIYLRLGSWRMAEEHFTAAAGDYQEQGRIGDLARVQVDRALTAYREGKAEDGAALAAEAFDLASSSEDRLALAQAHNIMAIFARGRDNLEAAAGHLGASLELATEMGDEDARIALMNNLSLVLGQTGDLAAAERTARTALELCVKLGDRHREAAIRNNLADLLRGLGREDESMEQLKAAVAIFADVAGDGGGLEPEIWKLVEW